MKKNLYQYFILLLLICFNAALVALALKVNVGVDSWAAFSQSLANAMHVKVGTMETILNCLCVFLELIILKKHFTWKHMMQIPLSFLIGYVINFVYYNILTFEFTYYPMKIIIIIGVYILSAIIVALIMTMNLITYPLEGVCHAFCQKYQYPFHQCRQGIDILCIIISLLLSLVLSMPFVVREGTVIGMILFGPMLGFAMKIIKSKQKNLS